MSKNIKTAAYGAAIAAVRKRIGRRANSVATVQIKIDTNLSGDTFEFAAVNDFSDNSGGIVK